MYYLATKGKGKGPSQNSYGKGGKGGKGQQQYTFPPAQYQSSIETIGCYKCGGRHPHRLCTATKHTDGGPLRDVRLKGKGNGALNSLEETAEETPLEAQTLELMPLELQQNPDQVDDWCSSDPWCSDYAHPNRFQAVQEEEQEEYDDDDDQDE